MRRILISAVIAMTATSALAAGITKEDAVESRRAYYRVLGHDMATLSALAKGEIEYNADTAKTAVANMMLLGKYDTERLYPAGTSNADMPGKTRALPVIWDDMAGLHAKADEVNQALVAMNEVAGEGRAALGKALGKLGGSCKGCHSDFRSKDF